MKLSEAVHGVRYKVTRGALQTLKKGDRVSINLDGTISCFDALGWLTPETGEKEFQYIKERTLIELDREYYQKQLTALANQAESIRQLLDKGV